MIDTVAFVAASCSAMAAGMSVAVAKLSPSIGPKLRHLFAGGSPLVVMLALRLEGGPSTTLDSMDLFGAGGLLALGVVTSSLMGKVVPTRSVEERRLPSR